jgi:allantoin racemase
MTEAACLTACMLGGRFAVLSLGAITAPYELLVERHGLAARCVEVRGVAATPQDALADPVRVQALLLEAIEGLARRADAIVLGGAALAGFDQVLQARSPVPLLDGIPCAVKLAEGLVGLGLPKQSVGPYAAPQGRATSGLSGPLAALLRG